MTESRPDRPPMIGALMRVPVEAVWKRIITDLHAAGFDEVTAAHIPLLRWPGPDGRRPSDVAAEAGMSKQALNYLLSQLVSAGYLTRDAHPADGRGTVIGLTARGGRLVATTRAIVAAIEAELTEELGERKFAQLKRLLVELNATAFVTCAL